MRGTRATAIDVLLEIVFGEFEARRAAIDDAAYRRTMALTEGRDLE